MNISLRTINLYLVCIKTFNNFSIFNSEDLYLYFSHVGLRWLNASFSQLSSPWRGMVWLMSGKHKASPRGVYFFRKSPPFPANNPTISSVSELQIRTICCMLMRCTQTAVWGFHVGFPFRSTLIIIIRLLQWKPKAQLRVRHRRSFKILGDKIIFW